MMMCQLVSMHVSMHVYHYYYYYHCASRKNWTYIWYFDVVFDYWCNVLLCSSRVAMYI